ncbi:MAG: hypothetical protein ACP5FZ_06635 [Fidelibacterota bacterium]
MIHRYPLKINVRLADQKTFLPITLRCSGNRIVDIDCHFADRLRNIQLVTDCDPEQALFPYPHRSIKLELLDLYLAQCRLIESHFQWTVPAYAGLIRSLLMELHRLLNHYHFFLALAMATEFPKLIRNALSGRTAVYRLLREIQSHAVTNDFFILGGIARDLPTGFLEKVLQTVTAMQIRLKPIENQLRKRTIFSNQLEKIGIISREETTMWQLSGPNRQACDPLLSAGLPASNAANSQKKIRLILHSKGVPGDAWHRTWVRLQEIRQSLYTTHNLVQEIFKTEIALSTPFHIGRQHIDITTDFSSAEGTVKCHITRNPGEKSFAGSYQYPAVNIISHLGLLLRGQRISDAGIIISSLNLNPIKHHIE